MSTQTTVRSATSLILLATAFLGSSGCYVQVAGHARRQADAPVSASQPAVIATEASLSGHWTDGDLILEIQGDESGFTVGYPNGRGPFTGRFIATDEVSVDFYDDPGCCTGRVHADGGVIRWSNGGSWRRLGALEPATSIEVVLHVLSARGGS